MVILERLVSIRRQMKELEKKIEQLEQQLGKYDKRYQVADKVSGGAGGKQHYTIKGFPQKEYSTKKTALMRNKMRLEKLQDEYMDTLVEADEYINSLEGSEIRLIMRHRYVDGMEWDRIAEKMNRKNKGDAVRIIHNRFVKSLENV